MKVPAPVPSSRRRRSALMALVFLVPALAGPSVGLARPATGAVDVVESLASQAMAAFKAGQFERAIELYLAAYQQDQSQAVLLFNAARVAHTGRLFGRAEELYQRVLSHPQAAPDKKAAAQTYLDQLRRERAEATAAEARRLADQGRHQEAAAEWRFAYRQLPERIEWLLAAARANSRAGEFLLAQRDYQEYLDIAKPSPARADAEAELVVLRLKQKQAEEAARPKVPPPAEVPKVIAAAPKAPPTLPPAIVAQVQPAAPLPGWSLASLIGGGAVVLGGAALYGWTWSEEQKLQESVQLGAKPTLTHGQASDRATVLEGRYQLGIGLAAAGAVAAAVGAYRIARPSRATVAVAPSPAGFALVASW